MKAFLSYTTGTLLTFLSLITTTLAGDVTIAVAANFTYPMQQLAKQFEQDTEHRAKLSFASSGKFYAQIQHGAPYDVFLSADNQKPKLLAKKGLANESSRFTYAIGRLALWSMTPAYVDQHGKVLQTGAFKHLAVADAKLAPYGMAAQQTLQTLGLLEQFTPILVKGENISQTYQFVFTGNSPLGFVAWSQIINPANGTIKSGSAWLVPAHYHEPIEQQAILLKRATNNPAADAFIHFLQSETAQTIIQSAGYDLPSTGKP